MKSRITIEVDFDNGNRPVIQILQRPSSDVRDNLLQAFLQSLQHTSRWVRIEFKGGDHTGVDPTNCWHLAPITVNGLPLEINLMKAVLGEQESEGEPLVNSNK